MSAEQLELVFLSGWLHGTVQLIRGTPRTYRNTLSSIFPDMERLVADRDRKASHGRSRSRSGSREENPYDHEDGGDLDLTSHGFEERTQSKEGGGGGESGSSVDEEDEEQENNYREECGSDYSTSVPASPMTPLSTLSPRRDGPEGVEGVHGTSLSTYGLSMLNKGLSMITHKVRVNRVGYQVASHAHLTTSLIVTLPRYCAQHD